MENQVENRLVTGTMLLWLCGTITWGYEIGVRDHQPAVQSYFLSRIVCYKEKYAPSWFEHPNSRCSHVTFRGFKRCP